MQLDHLKTILLVRIADQARSAPEIPGLVIDELVKMNLLKEPKFDTLCTHCAQPLLSKGHGQGWGHANPLLDRQHTPEPLDLSSSALADYAPGGERMTITPEAADKLVMLLDCELDGSRPARPSETRMIFEDLQALFVQIRDSRRTSQVVPISCPLMTITPQAAGLIAGLIELHLDMPDSPASQEAIKTFEQIHDTLILIRDRKLQNVTLQPQAEVAEDLEQLIYHLNDKLAHPISYTGDAEEFVDELLEELSADRPLAVDLMDALNERLRGDPISRQLDPDKFAEELVNRLKLELKATHMDTRSLTPTELGVGPQTSHYSLAQITSAIKEVSSSHQGKTIDDFLAGVQRALDGESTISGTQGPQEGQGAS